MADVARCGRRNRRRHRARAKSFLNNFTIALEAAVGGLGVALADRHLVARELESGRLVSPFDIAVSSKNAYWMVYPKDRADKPKIAAFRDWLLAEVAMEKEGITSVEGTTGTDRVLLAIHG